MKENSDASPIEVAEVVVNQQMASALKSHDKIHIFLRAIITSVEDFTDNREDHTEKSHYGASSDRRRGGYLLRIHFGTKVFPCHVEAAF